MSENRYPYGATGLNRYPPSTIHKYLDLSSTQIIQTHTDITPPHPSRPWSKHTTYSPLTPPTPPQPKYRHMSNTPPVPTGMIKPKPNSLIHSPPLSIHTAPNQTHTHVTHSTNTSHYTHLKHVTCTRQNT